MLKHVNIICFDKNVHGICFDILATSDNKTHSNIVKDVDEECFLE